MSAEEMRIVDLYLNIPYSHLSVEQIEYITNMYNHIMKKYSDKQKTYATSCKGCSEMKVSYQPFNSHGYWCSLCVPKNTPSLQQIIHTGDIKMLESEISLISLE